MLSGAFLKGMKKIVILAPHPDDEIIGLWRILETVDRQCITVVYGEAPDDFIPPPILNIPSFFLASKVEQADFWEQEQTIYFFPDPIHETHPEHRAWGSFGETLLRRGKSIISFYSVNMLAPYITVLRSEYAERKRNLLETVYPEKKDLWKYDHKYFLFEGCCFWY